MIFDGYLERYPGLKICIAHGGGYIPAYAGRFDHPFPLRDDCRVNISKPPSEYLKKLCDIGVLEEQKLGKEKLFVNPKLMQLLTKDTNSFKPY